VVVALVVVVAEFEVVADLTLDTGVPQLAVAEVLVLAAVSVVVVVLGGRSSPGSFSAPAVPTM
jgi:hypothetical protein